MNVLIVSIVRNEAIHLARWHSQLVALAKGCPEHQFCLSVFENDSSDESARMLASFDYSPFKAHLIQSAKLNVPYFVGGKHPTRTELLAYCRNKAIYSFEFLKDMDTVLVVEPDVEYSFETAERIVNHEKHYGQRFDVFSGKSVHPGTQSIYDSWGTRKTKDQTDWRDGDEDGMVGLAPMWSTFNCLVAYRAQAIREGHTFGGVNPRTNQPDCDTVVIAERFRAAGYDKIAWDNQLYVTHYCTP